MLRSAPVLILIFKPGQQSVLHPRLNMKFPASNNKNLITTIGLKAAS